MTTIKIKTPTTINYCIIIGGLWFSVRKNNKGFWKSVSYDYNMSCTDSYKCTVLDGFKTKREALISLKLRVNEAPKGFFHNI
jgi:hypothetical protein